MKARRNEVTIATCNVAISARGSADNLQHLGGLCVPGAQNRRSTTNDYSQSAIPAGYAAMNNSRARRALPRAVTLASLFARS